MYFRLIVAWIISGVSSIYLEDLNCKTEGDTLVCKFSEAGIYRSWGTYRKVRRLEFRPRFEDSVLNAANLDCLEEIFLPSDIGVMGISGCQLLIGAKNEITLYIGQSKFMCRTNSQTGEFQPTSSSDGATASDSTVWMPKQKSVDFGTSSSHTQQEWEPISTSAYPSTEVHQGHSQTQPSTVQPSTAQKDPSTDYYAATISLGVVSAGSVVVILILVLLHKLKMIRLKRLQFHNVTIDFDTPQSQVAVLRRTHSDSVFSMPACSSVERSGFARSVDETPVRTVYNTRYQKKLLQLHAEP